MVYFLLYGIAVSIGKRYDPGAFPYFGRLGKSDVERNHLGSVHAREPGRHFARRLTMFSLYNSILAENTCLRTA